MKVQPSSPVSRYALSSALASIIMLAASPGFARQVPEEKNLPDSASAGNDSSEATAQDIIVTGFRASLDNAISQKRQETAAIDAIVAEDIGKFPDTNLAESMQRVPGVALARGDGGEGRNIAVRGLGASFTRVRINGMEATSQTATSNIYGTQNSARNFDFNAFPTELFSALVVRKTPSADVEEGSLGATVDLQAPKPLDGKKDFVLSATARGVYSELSRDLGPRASLLVSKKFADGRFGILASAAYQQRKMREVGYNASDIISANTNGLFCTPLGYAPAFPLNAAKGADAANCSAGNPRTGSLEAYETIAGLTRPDAPNTPGSGAFLPRLPSYLNNTQDQERIGGTLTLQFQPDDDTDISVDLLYSRFNVTRLDTVIGALSFGRSISNNGQPMTSVRDAQFDEKGSLVYGVFDGVDLFSDSQQEEFSSTFKQVNFNFKHNFTDRLSVSTLFGLNKSDMDGKRRQHTYLNANDVDDFTIDFRNGHVPQIGLGIDPSNLDSWVYGPPLADGTVRGSFDFQNRPASTITNGLTAEFNTTWTASDRFTFLFGGQYRQSHYHATTSRPYTADLVVEDLPAGMTLADITTQVTGLDTLWGHGAPASYVIIDPDKWADVFDAEAVRFCSADCGGGDSRVKEDVSSAYVRSKFDFTDLVGFGVRGDAGLRYVHTRSRASGVIAVAPPAGVISPTGVVSQYASVSRSYEDWLPSANIVIEPATDVLLRFAAAKVMSRPDLSFLTPTSGVTATTRVGTVNNPYLEPIRATTFDAAVEWYFRPGSLLSVAFFHKDIKTFIQRVTNIVPFSSLGLPDELLIGSPATPDDLFTVSQPVNTPGGPLNGVEVNLQLPLTFLPAPFRNFGVLANYTHVQSKIEYLLTATNGGTTTADLVGASRNTASGTLYYEDDRFSIRSTINWRDKFIRAIPASPGSDLQGNAPSIYVDASASYSLTENLKLIVEAQNLTNEQNRFYIDSSRQDTLYQTRVGRTISVGVNAQF